MWRQPSGPVDDGWRLFIEQTRPPVSGRSLESSGERCNSDLLHEPILGLCFSPPNTRLVPAALIWIFLMMWFEPMMFFALCVHLYSQIPRSSVLPNFKVFVAVLTLFLVRVLTDWKIPFCFCDSCVMASDAGLCLVGCLSGLGRPLKL